MSESPIKILRGLLGDDKPPGSAEFPEAEDPSIPIAEHEAAVGRAPPFVSDIAFQVFVKNLLIQDKVPYGRRQSPDPPQSLSYPIEDPGVSPTLGPGSSRVWRGCRTRGKPRTPEF